MFFEGLGVGVVAGGAGVKTTKKVVNVVIFVVIFILQVV